MRWRGCIDIDHGRRGIFCFRSMVMLVLASVEIASPFGGSGVNVNVHIPKFRVFAVLGHAQI